MTVTQFTRFSGGKPDAMVAVARKAKAMQEKAGAEMFRVSRFHTGPWAGQWLVVGRYPDWATYGRAMQALTADPAWHAIMTEVTTIAKLEGRTLLTGVDL